MSKKLRIIFMGTPQFSVPALEALAAAHDVIAVYCQPVRPAGRGHKLQPCAVQLAAEQRGIPVYSPVSFRKEPKAVEIFKSHQADLAVVAAYGLILPQVILDAPRLGCVNIHASLLPRWRGAAPLQRAIEAGDSETGISIMKMEAGLDTGPVWRMARVPITEETTLPELHDAMSALGAAEIIAALPAVAADEAPMPQPEAGVTYAHKVTREEGKIDWTQDAAIILRKLRAFTPWPGLFFMQADKRVKLLDATIGATTDAAPGTVQYGGTIACGHSTSLAPINIQPEGGKPQSFTDYLNGARLKAGDHLG